MFAIVLVGVLSILFHGVGNWVLFHAVALNGHGDADADSRTIFFHAVQRLAFGVDFLPITANQTVSTHFRRLFGAAVPVLQTEERRK